MSRPTPWPVPCRKASPQPASSMTSRHAGRPPWLRRPARDGRDPGRLGGGHHLEHPLLGGARPRRWRWCGSCPSSSRRPGPRSRARRGRPRWIRRGPGRAWGLAAFGPDATIVSKLLPVGAEAADLGVELEAELLLGRALRQPVADRGQRGVGDGAGGLDAGHLPGVLHQPEPVDQALGGHQLGVGEPLAGVRAAGPRSRRRPPGRGGPTPDGARRRRPPSARR